MDYKELKQFMNRVVWDIPNVEIGLDQAIQGYFAKVGDALFVGEKYLGTIVIPVGVRVVIVAQSVKVDKLIIPRTCNRVVLKSMSVVYELIKPSRSVELGEGFDSKILADDEKDYYGDGENNVLMIEGYGKDCEVGVCTVEGKSAQQTRVFHKNVDINCIVYDISGGGRFTIYKGGF